MRLKVTYDQKYDYPTFTLIRPQNPIHQKGEQFHLVDWLTDDLFTTAYLIDKQTLTLDEITRFHSFIDKNVDVDLYKTIVQQNFKKWNAVYYDFMLFTKKENIKELNIVEPYTYKQ